VDLDYYATRVAVITGAGSGIGRALAVDLAGRGARLALSDRHLEAVAETARICRDAGAEVRADQVDVTDPDQVFKYATEVVEEFGRVELVFCVAGVIISGDLLKSTFTDIAYLMNINVLGVMHTAKAFLPHVIASGGGHIVTVSSALGLMATPYYSAYSASKFAVRGFSESLQQEMALGGHRVYVSCVYPGGVRTPIVRTGRFAPGEDAAATIASFEAKIARTEPEAAAATILRGVQRRQPRILVGADARLVAALVRVAGSAYPALLPWLGRRARLLSKTADRSPTSTGGR